MVLLSAAGLGAGARHARGPGLRAAAVADSKLGAAQGPGADGPGPPVVEASAMVGDENLYNLWENLDA